MDYIKTIQQVKNNKVIVDIPEDFISKYVEVIILPAESEKEHNEKLMKVSEQSFKEWDNSEDEIYNNL